METQNNIQEDSLNKSDGSSQDPLSDHKLQEQLLKKYSSSHSQRKSCNQEQICEKIVQNGQNKLNQGLSDNKILFKNQEESIKSQNGAKDYQSENLNDEQQNNNSQLGKKQTESQNTIINDDYYYDQIKDESDDKSKSILSQNSRKIQIKNQDEEIYLEKNQSSPQAIDSYLSSRSSISQDEISFRNNPKFYKLAVLTSQNNNQEIVQMLQDDDDIDIVKLIDIKGYSLVHKCCLNGNKELLITFIEYAKNFELKQRKQQNKQKIYFAIRDWINLKEIQEGFTALHLASFKGNLKTIQLLVENGADINLKSKQGLNVTHLAAQGNQPKSIVYFITKGLSPQSTDNKSTSPLHWASFLQSENVVNLLVSTYLNVDLNLQDQDGFTPLHLASMKGDYKIVKKLLIRGADKNRKDFKGDLPIQYAKEYNYEHIVEMLSDSSSLQQTCNIKPGLTKQRKNLKQIIFYMILFTVLFLFFFFFYFPILSFVETVIIYSLSGLTTVFFLMAWLINPGYINEGQKNMIQLLKLLTIYDDNDICMDCFIVKTPRSRHCEICQKCVSHYDHHCPWINNCVGVNNHPSFLLFVITVTLNIIAVVILILLHIFTLNYENLDNNTYSWFNDLNEEQQKNYQLAVLILSILVLGVLGFFTMALMILVLVQIKNFFLNRTTFERFSLKTNMAQSQTTDMTHQSSISQNNKNITNNNRYSYLQIFKPKCSFSNCFKMCYQNQKEYKKIMPYKDDRNASMIIKMQQSSIIESGVQPLLDE